MDAVDSAKQSAVSGMEMFLRNFSHIPDEKLDWTPAPTAKSAIRIAAHTALYAGRFAHMIRDRRLPVPENLEAWLEGRNAEEAAITTRDQVEVTFRKGTAELLAALDALTPEDLDLSLDSGQGWSILMRQFIGIPGMHANLHTGQIDYLQTCWDDQQVYVG